jgi:hypothetical protein
MSSTLVDAARFLPCAVGVSECVSECVRESVGECVGEWASVGVTLLLDTAAPGPWEPSPLLLLLLLLLLLAVVVLPL